MSMQLHPRFQNALPALLLGLVAIGLPCSLFAADLPVLRVYNWEVYLDPELADEFGRRHGVKVQETYFGSDTERDRRLADGKGNGFDLVIVDTAQVAVYRDRGWLAPIGESRVPGLGAWRRRRSHRHARVSLRLGHGRYRVSGRPGARGPGLVAGPVHAGHDNLRQGAGVRQRARARSGRAQGRG
jgi:hypothetical protein